jgi:uncharacterized membrane protein (UPF0136 family)
MTPILASNFSNLYAFVWGVPALLFALLFGAVGAYFRAWSLGVLAGGIFFAASVLFFTSIPNANESDVGLTKIFAWSALVLAAFALCAFLYCRAKSRPRPFG